MVPMPSSRSSRAARAGASMTTLTPGRWRPGAVLGVSWSRRKRRLMSTRASAARSARVRRRGSVSSSERVARRRASATMARSSPVRSESRRPRSPTGLTCRVEALGAAGSVSMRASALSTHSRTTVMVASRSSRASAGTRAASCSANSSTWWGRTRWATSSTCPADTVALGEGPGQHRPLAEAAGGAHQSAGGAVAEAALVDEPAGHRGGAVGVPQLGRVERRDRGRDARVEPVALAQRAHDRLAVDAQLEPVDRLGQCTQFGRCRPGRHLTHDPTQGV